MKNRDQVVVASLLFVFAIGTRFLFNALEVVNVNAVMACALFAGAYLSSKRLSMAIPFAAMLISDAIIGLYDLGLMSSVYGSILLGILFGRAYQERSTLLRYFGAVLGSSMAFFLITNFAVWLFGDGSFYPKTADGLLLSYSMALPFYRNSLLGDFAFTTALFGVYEFVVMKRALKSGPSLA